MIKKGGNMMGFLQTDPYLGNRPAGMFSTKKELPRNKLPRILAQQARESLRFIYRSADGLSYFIFTDVFGVKLWEKEYQTFADIWSKYKGNKRIPPIIAKGYSVNYLRDSTKEWIPKEGDAPFRGILTPPKIEEETTVSETDFLIELGESLARVYRTCKGLRTVSEDYHQMFLHTEGHFYTDGGGKYVKVSANNEVTAVLMEYRFDIEGALENLMKEGK